MGNKYGVGGHLALYALRKNLLMKWIEFLCEYLFLQGSSLITIPSEAAVNQFKVFHLERKNKIIINPVPQIVGQGNIIFRKQIHKLIFAGHVDWRKGLDILIKTLSKLDDLHLHLDVAGLYDVNSKYSKEIQKIINEYQLNNNVFFHGYLCPETLAHLYKNSDLFVFPSRHETFGMVLVEAMSFGLPIVTSSIPTTVEIIKDKVNGILYETEDTDALAEAIRKLAYDSDLRYSIIQNNVKLSKKFRNREDVGNENFNATLPFLNK
jgi:glycosyltransferase involved in cell wall biosynthesis